MPAFLPSAGSHPPPDTHTAPTQECSKLPRTKQNPVACNSGSNLLLQTYRLLGPDQEITVLHSAEAGVGERIRATVNYGTGVGAGHSPTG